MFLIQESKGTVVSVLRCIPTNGAPTMDCSYTQKNEEPSSKNEDSPLFQIFGINLYYDDILLVCLIFFLYQEGVKDEGLFLALILLLLS